MTRIKIQISSVRTQNPICALYVDDNLKITYLHNIIDEMYNIRENMQILKLGGLMLNNPDLTLVEAGIRNGHVVKVFDKLK